MQTLIASIDISNVVGLRDRALIALMTVTFGRIQASLNMNQCDYYDDGKNWSIKLNEKNGKVYVLHAFIKKSAKTPRTDLDLAQKRLKQLLLELKLEKKRGMSL